MKITPTGCLRSVDDYEDMRLHSPNALSPSKVLSATRLQTHYKNMLLAYALHSY